MSKSKELIKNTLILGFGRLTSQLIGFLLLPLYTYHLNPSEFGFIDIVTVYLTLIVPSLTLQLEMASFRFLLEVRNDELGIKKVLTNISALTTILVLPWTILYLVLFAIFNWSFGIEILIASLNLLLFNFGMQISRGLGRNLDYALSSILNGISLVLGAFIFVVWGGLSIQGVLISISVSYSISALFLFVKLQLWKYLQFSQVDTALFRELLGYSVPLVPNNASWWLINASGRTIVTFFLGTAANGLYAVANKYSSILASFYSIFTMSWTESASQYIDAPDRDTFFSKVANTSIKVFGSLGLLLISSMPFIFPILVGDGFEEALQYVPVLVIAAFLNVVVSIYSAVYIAKKLTVQVMLTSLAAGVINLVLALCFVPIFGLWAAAGATACSYLIMAIYRHIDSRKYVKIIYKKINFIGLISIGTISISLYYLDYSWANALGISIVALFTLIFNFNELKSMSIMLLKKQT